MNRLDRSETQMLVGHEWLSSSTVNGTYGHEGLGWTRLGGCIVVFYESLILELVVDRAAPEVFRKTQRHSNTLHQ